LRIVDDGVGFRPANSGRRSFGLQTMQERAESVGGKLIIKSTERKGTEIQCHLPCLRPERIQKQSLVIGD
jgi:two-component system, NarL family, sensor histidine kinase LiaS